MALDTLTATVRTDISWNARKSITGTDYQAIVNATSFAKQFDISSALAVGAAGGGNELASFLTTLTASSSASIDLTSVTNILAVAAQAFARVKLIVIRVLSASDDATNGTAAAGVEIDNTVSNGLSSQSNAGWFSNAAEGAANGSQFTIPNGGLLIFGTPSAGGVLVDATHKVIKLTNLDGALSAKVQCTFIGGAT